MNLNRFFDSYRDDTLQKQALKALRFLTAQPDAGTQPEIGDDIEKKPKKGKETQKETNKAGFKDTQ